jgi:DNA-binding CsgD family transcriptional regulator
MIIDGEYEYHVVIRAKAGDRIAFGKLWNAYRFIMIGMLKYLKYLTPEEKESEAALVLIRKLELFNPAKVNKSPETWTFSYMLTGGMKNARRKLVNAMKNESVVKLGIRETFLDISVSSSDYPVYSSGQCADVVALNYYDYVEKNSPERYALTAAGGSADEKMRKLEKGLSPFQGAVLSFRRAGLTLREVADRMGCGYTTVRMHIKKAELIAALIFGFDYRSGHWSKRTCL